MSKKEKDIVEVRPGRYFMAVSDCKTFRGRMGSEEQLEEEYRIFNQKFVDSPEKALFLMCDMDNKRWKFNVTPEDIMKDVKYCPETNEYIRTSILTTGFNPPLPHHMEKIMAGEYEYIRFEERIQVFETSLVSDTDMVRKAIKQWKDFRKAFF